MNAQADRTVLEIRELLRKTRNRDAVAQVIANRGMSEEEARDLVYSIHKENLSINRKSGLGIMIGSGIVIAIFALLYMATADRISTTRVRIAIIGLPIAVLGFLWGFVRFIMASGYEIDED